MIGLRIEFTSGRFHATPWGHHVNEGQVEWPPSPWRIGRALASAAFAEWGDVPPAARSLCVKLASGRPEYALPPSTEAHTRHYMPSGKSTAKVIDAFRAFDRDDAVVRIIWPDVVLGAEEAKALQVLLPACSYLGRAESWAEWTTGNGDLGQRHAWPLATEELEPAAVEVAALASHEAFAAWLDGFQSGGGKAEKAPTDRWSALTFDTGTLHQGRWSGPPGMTLARYALRAPQARRATQPSRRQVPASTTAVYVVSSRVLPLQSHALALGESMRRALMARSDGHAVFSGKDDAGQPLQGNRHTYVIPSCTHRTSDGVDRIALWCAGGFPRDVEGAISGLNWLRRTDGRGSGDEAEQLSLTFVGFGEASDFGASRQSADTPRLRQLGESTVWESVSPFVCTRHAKRRGGVVLDAPEEQVRRALLRTHPEAEVERIEPRFARPEEEVRWARPFYRSRLRGGGSQGGSRGYAFRIILRGPIRGPLMLGYGAHLGLGQFAAVTPG